MLLRREREEVLKYCREMVNEDLTTGTGGNISIYNREEDLIAMSPSGVDYFEMKPKDVVVIDIDGNIIDGDLKPSSETNMHLIFYKNRKEVTGIVHTHSKYATTIASMGWKLEPVHYLIAMAGYDVNCADYATYGTEELAQNALDAIGERNAVLLANHGLITLGRDVGNAFSIANQLEFVSEIYYMTKTLPGDGGKLLTKDQLDEVMEKFNTHIYK